jgi:hypothetical protein
LLIGVGFPRDVAAAADLLCGLPFINMELVDQEAFEQFAEQTVATDCDSIPKGMIEVIERINQFNEQIARFEAWATTSASE